MRLPDRLVGQPLLLKSCITRATAPRSLQLRFPKPVQITILVNGLWLAIASADYRFGLVGQVHSDTTRLGLDIDKDNVVFREHRVSLATNFNLDSTVVNLLNYGNVLLVAGIDSVGNQLLHLLTTTHYGYA